MIDPLRLAVLATPSHDGILSLTRYADELTAALRERPGLEVRVAPSLARGAEGRGLRGRTRRATARFVGAPRAARRVDADVFHLTDHSYAHLAAVLPRSRTVVTCHDLMPLRATRTDSGFPPVPRATLAWYAFCVSFLRRVDHVVCISETTRGDVLRWTGVAPERASVIPNGLSGVFRPLPEAERVSARTELAAPGRVLLSVGSGASYKNVEGTLAVLALLRAGGNPALLVRAGAPLNPAQAQRARALGVADAIRDLGPVDEERLVALYNAADALLFPSHWEGFGWPPLEAMACGTPVVVSTTPALRETVGDAALSAPAGDPTALAGAIERLWSDPGLAAELHGRGLERARRFSWATTVGRYEELYRATARSPRGSG